MSQTPPDKKKKDKDKKKPITQNTSHPMPPHWMEALKQPFVQDTLASIVGGQLPFFNAQDYYNGFYGSERSTLATYHDPISEEQAAKMNKQYLFRNQDVRPHPGTVNIYTKPTEWHSYESKRPILSHEIGHHRDITKPGELQELVSTGAYDRQTKKDPDAYASKNQNEFYAERVTDAVQMLADIMQIAKQGDPHFSGGVKALANMYEEQKPGTIYMVRKLLNSPIYKDHPANKRPNILTPK